MSLAAQLLLSFWAGALAFADWRHRRLPNAWLLLGLAFGVVHLAVRGTMPFGGSPLDAALASLLALLAFLPLYAAGWMGAGDVKFLAVIGWLGGFPVLAGALLYGSLLAGGLALLLLQPGGLPGSRAAGVLRGRIPYGSCLAAALVPQLWGWLDLGFVLP